MSTFFEYSIDQSRVGAKTSKEYSVTNDFLGRRSYTPIPMHEGSLIQYSAIRNFKEVVSYIEIESNGGVCGSYVSVLSTCKTFVM